MTLLRGDDQAMKQILQNLRTGETELADVPCPALLDGHVLFAQGAHWSLLALNACWSTSERRTSSRRHASSQIRFTPC